MVRWIVLGVAACTVLLVVCSFIPVMHIWWDEDVRVYDSIESIPYRSVGLLLGTSQYVRNGQVNPYYRARLRTAADLYAQGKIETILASGDNQFRSYNEPHAMKKTLLALGVRDEDIILDYAGFRTFDSVLRASKVFGINNYTIITQHPHTIRALYIADQFGYNAISYAAALPRGGSRIRFHIREALARIKTLLDIHVLRTTPRFLGSSIQVSR